MSTQQSELQSRNKKAHELCLAASIRPYCQKVFFFIYDLNNPKDDEDCNNTGSMILQDAVSDLLKLEKTFDISTKINSSLIRGFVYGTRTIKAKSKDGKQSLKIIINSQSIPRREWDSAEEEMNSRF